MDGIWNLITAAFASWYDAKMIVERAGTVSSDALHVIAGVAIQLLFAILFRKPLSSWSPWLVVLAGLLFNETVDIWVERWPSRAMQLAESGKDVVLTMLLPTALMLSSRWSPALRPARKR